MITKPPLYYSFLLTTWEERSAKKCGDSTWRFSLQEVNSGRRRVFISAGELLAFVESMTGGTRSRDGPD